MFQTEFVKKTKTNILFSIFPKIVPVWDSVEKCCRARQVTDDNMAHAHWILDT